MQPEKKYFKRGDLAAIQQQEYMQKYGSKAEETVTEKERIREEKVEEKKRGKLNKYYLAGILYELQLLLGLRQKKGLVDCKTFILSRVLQCI
jgi:hypothetical protein